MKQWKHIFNFRSKRGVGTMVDAAMVLGIAAAVIFVTVAGSSLVQKANLGDIITDLEAFKKATEQFETKYSAIPGDYVIANASTTPLKGATTGGNGNGAIDSAAEALLFWNHLAVAGLIQGKYDGSSTNVPGSGVPEGALKDSGYKIIIPTSASLPSQAIVIEFSGFTSSSNAQPILKPEDAKYIDEQIDDGIPDTGIVRAVDNGSNGCFTGTGKTSVYTLDNEDVACRLRVILRISSEATQKATTGACNEAGLIREIPDKDVRCPAGFYGKVMQSCRFTDDASHNNEGVWDTQKLESHCEPVTCSGSRKFGEERRLPCVNGQTGGGVIQKCSAEGVWTTTSINCTPDASACSPDASLRAPQACNWTQGGRVKQTCTAGVWATTNNSCATLTCAADGTYSAGTYGEVKVSAASGCSTATSGNYLGTYNATCTMDGKWKVTSNSCSPQYGNAGDCTSGVTEDRNIGCPPGETGEHFQTCVDNGSSDFWTTLRDTCVPIRCSGEPIGTARVVEGVTCPGKRAGIIIEVCESDNAIPPIAPKGIWTPSTSHCTSYCRGNEDKAGYATWVDTDVSTNSVSGTCLTGYTGTPTRNCDATGAWSSVTGACTRITCPTSYDNATWPTTNSRTEAVSATNCSWPDFEGAPVATCDATGTWQVTSPCKASDLPVKGTALKLWLDASDSSTLYTDNTYATKARPNGSDTIGAWKDKSGNGYNAIQGTAANRPLYIGNTLNQKPVLRFDGTDDIMTGTITGFTGNKDLTIFVVNKYNTTALQHAFTFNNAGTIIAMELHNPNYKLFQQSAHESLYTPVDTSYHVFSGTHDSATNLQKLYVDSNSETSNQFSAAALNLDATYAVGGATGLTRPLNGDIGEVIVYNSVLSVDSRQSVEVYLSNKWGVPIIQPIVPLGNLKLWLDANDSAYLFTGSDCSTGPNPANNATIGCWKDKAGSVNGGTYNNATQATAGNRPKIVYDTFNSRPVVYFTSASSKYFTTGTTNLPTGANARSVYTVVSFDDAGQQQYYYTMGSATATQRLTLGLKATDFTLHSDISGSIMSTGKTLTSATPYVIGIIYSGGELNTAVMRVNGEAQNFQGTSATLNTTYGVSNVGATQAPGNYFGGNMAEFMVYDKALSDTEAKTLEAYLATKWGVGIVGLPVTAGLQLWLDGADKATMYTSTDCSTGASPANGSSIACWGDKSWNRNNATQSTAASQPTVKYPAMNGKPAIIFDGTNDMLTGTAGFAGNQSSTIFIAGKYNNTNLQHAFTLSSTNALLAISLHSPNYKLFQNGANESLYTPIDTLYHVFAGTHDTTTNGQKLYVDGNSETSNQFATSALNADSAYAVGGAASMSRYMNGAIAEVVAYKRALSVSERNTMNSYLRDKWSTSLPLTSNLKLWLDAADLSSMFTNTDCATGPYPTTNTKILCWKDKSGNTGYSATQSNSNYQPTVQYSIKNYKPIVRFDGTDDIMTGTITGFTGNKDLTIFVVNKYNTTALQHAFTFNNAGTIIAMELHNPNYKLFQNGANESLYTPVDTSFHVFSGTHDTTTNLHKLYVDGNTETSNQFSASALNLDATYAVGNASGLVRPLSGDIGEVIVYNSVLSNGNRQTIEAYLKNKWAIP